MSRRLNLSRLLIFTLLLAVSALGSAVKLSIAFNGMTVGTADFTLTRMPNGGLKTLAVMNISNGGFNATITTKGEYNKQGRPIKETSIQKLPGGTKTVEATFGTANVKVKITENGKTTNKTVNYPKGKSLNRASHFWFIRDKPKVGAVDPGIHLDMETLKFQAESEKYIGLEKITVGGKSYTAHKTSHKKGTMWLDSKGMPLRMNLDQDGVKMVLERK